MTIYISFIINKVKHINIKLFNNFIYHERQI